MDINTIFGIGIIAFFSYLVYSSLKPKTLPFKAERYGLLVGQDTGKSKINQSKTGDASLAIERSRRKAIQNGSKLKIKETKTQLGSTSGALETFFISRICPCVKTCQPYDIIFDGGGEEAEYCDYISDGYLDAGDDTTKACGV